VSVTGGCYCGALRYEIFGEIPMRALCLCATCQKISGGAGNLFLGLESAAFNYTKGAPASFALSEESPAREFCQTCGVHVASRSPKAPGGIIVKVGTLDDPSGFNGPQMIFWTSEKQDYHILPQDVPSYETVPGRSA
jgi:hypothetical protein